MTDGGNGEWGYDRGVAMSRGLRVLRGTLLRPAACAADGQLIHHEEAGRSHEGHEAAVASVPTGKPEDVHLREARVCILLRDLRVAFLLLRDKNRDRSSMSVSLEHCWTVDQ